jgi:predicted esterase
MFTVLALSCSSGHHGKSAGNTPPRSLTEGKVLPNVVCLGDPSVSYALYLPINYTAQKKFPLILAFDPHAGGALPVERYKELAERYGYILIGSNNSKNGQPQSESASIISALFTEISTQYSVDTSRIYLTGFSGGARIASMIGFYHGGVAGIIGCGAGLPGSNEPIRYKCDYIGFAGRGDFNMFELLKLNDQLGQAGINHSLILFDGPHSWPPAPVMEEGFYWLEFCAMREKLIPSNMRLIANYVTTKDELLKNEEANNNYLNEYDDLKNIIGFLDGVTSTDKYRERLKTVGDMPVVKQALKTRSSMMEKELEQQRTYSESFFVKDLKWWKKVITDYGLRITKYKKPEDTLAAKRMLSYLSLVAYMSSSRALAGTDTADAQYALQIYQWVDPDNSEVYYLTALLKAKERNAPAVLSALKTAIGKGFTDKARMQQQPEFEPLQSTREYLDLLQQMK